jgi:hypothetical protein
MINEQSFLNQLKNEERKMENKRTKEEAQAELIEKFNLRKTSDFQVALQKGEINLAQSWLNYIVENRESFPQYEPTWDNWLSDRQNEITLYESLKNDGSLEKMEHRSKEEAQAELKEKFGFADTKGFRKALQNDIETAEQWLNYIVDNKLSFPQYLSTWDSWLADRQQELAATK